MYLVAVTDEIDGIRAPAAVDLIHAGLSGQPVSAPVAVQGISSTPAADEIPPIASPHLVGAARAKNDVSA
jgi:hypothetical protein